MTDQAELDQLAEAELERLQRQNRSLQCDLRTLLEEKANILQKQNKLISILQLEHEQLRTEIATLQDGVHAKKEQLVDRKLKEIYEQNASQQMIIEEEKKNLCELEGHIKKIDRKIDSLRKNEVPDSCYKETLAKVQKDVIKLENRLDVVNKKCSDVLTENCKLREAIDHMLQDRAHFNEMWQTMVTQFNDGKKYIMDLIDQSTLAFDQREELCNKLQALKDRNENDKMIHIQEMREIQRRLEHDAKLLQFYEIKGQRRINTELEQREANKKNQQKEDCEKKLAEYNNIIEQLKLLSEESVTEKLSAQFTRQEEENFALFSYVNELSHEVELLNDTTQDLNDEIEKQKAQEKENAYKRKTEAIDHLESTLEATNLKAKTAFEQKQSVDTQLQQLLCGIEHIFSQIRCDDAPILNVLSTKTFLTVHNVKLYLGIIERRINDIINNANIDDVSTKILAKKDRIPKFNVKESVKIKI